jgi:hypothetical protein
MEDLFLLGFSSRKSSIQRCKLHGTSFHICEKSGRIFEMISHEHGRSLPSRVLKPNRARFYVANCTARVLTLIDLFGNCTIHEVEDYRIFEMVSHDLWKISSFSGSQAEKSSILRCKLHGTSAHFDRLVR